MPRARIPVPVMTAIVAAAATVLVAVIGVLQTRIEPEKPKPVEVRGRVRDVAGWKPIAGAKITYDLDGIPYTVYSDSEGVFRVQLSSSAGVAKIAITADGYVPYERNTPVTVGGQLEDIRLEPLEKPRPAASEGLGPAVPGAGVQEGRTQDDQRLDVSRQAASSSRLWTYGDGGVIVLPRPARILRFKATQSTPSESPGAFTIHAGGPASDTVTSFKAAWPNYTSVEVAFPKPIQEVRVRNIGGSSSELMITELQFE